MPKKVIFINTINPYEELQYRYPHLGLGYLVSSLRQHFGNDMLEFKVIDRNIESELAEFKPHIVGITSVTQNYNIAKEYAEIVKAKGLPVIIGGIHISALPHLLTPDMEIGVIGEGERTIIEIFELFLGKGKIIKDDLSKIKGIVYRDHSGNLNITQKRELITSLDNIPFPARDFFRIKTHSYLFSSRGCPYRCVFCASSHFWNKVRFFSAEYVVAEIKELIERYGVKLISFYDDLMIADLERLRKIAILLQKEHSLRRVKFSLNARANLLTEEVVGLLKDINVVSVGMGLESGSEKILHYLKGNSVTIEDNKRAIRTLKKFKIVANASFVIGSPQETREEILQTLNFIKTSGLSFVDTCLLTPYPGTPLWEYAKKNGMVSEDMDWDRLETFYPIYSSKSHYSKAVILSQMLNREELYSLFLKFQRQRLFLSIQNLLWHPFFLDICGVLVRKIVGKLRKLINRGKFT